VEREGAARLSPSTRDPVTWARRKKMRFARIRASPEHKKLGKGRAGWECSTPERFAHGQWRTAQFAYAGTRRRKSEVVAGRSGIRPGRTPRTRVLAIAHLSGRKRRRLAVEARLHHQYPRKGRDCEGLERLSLVRHRRKRKPPRRTRASAHGRREGNCSRRTSHPQIQSWCAT